MELIDAVVKAEGLPVVEEIVRILIALTEDDQREMLMFMRGVMFGRINRSAASDRESAAKKATR